MYPTILANIARHIHLSPVEQTYFTNLLVPEHVARQQHLLLAGQPTRWLTFVVQGCARTYVVDGLLIAEGEQTYAKDKPDV